MVKNGAQGKRNDLDVFAEMVLEKGGLTDEVIDAMPGHAMRYNKHAKDLVQLQKVNDAKDAYRDWETDRKSTRLNSSHITRSRMPSSA